MSRGTRTIPLAWSGPIPFTRQALDEHETALAVREGKVNAECAIRGPGVYGLGREERGMLIIGCTPIYVGEAIDIAARLRRHLSPTSRSGTLAGHVTGKPVFFWYANLDLRDRKLAEEALIRHHRPLANTVHKPGEPAFDVVLKGPVPNWRRNP